MITCLSQRMDDSGKCLELNSLSGTLLSKFGTMRIFLFIVLLTTFTRLSAQSDTVVVFYDREGKPCQEIDATKLALQVKEDDHYKKLTVDMRDKKVESIAYFSDRKCMNFDGPY